MASFFPPFFQAGIVYLGDVQCEAWWQLVTSTTGGQLMFFLGGRVFTPRNLRTIPMKLLLSWNGGRIQIF